MRNPQHWPVWTCIGAKNWFVYLLWWEPKGLSEQYQVGITLISFFWGEEVCNINESFHWKGYFYISFLYIIDVQIARW